MKKYLLRYLFFWAPAFLTACFFNNASGVSQVLQWFFAFFMVFGWCANTAMAAYHYPRNILADLFIYLGANLLVITLLYNYNTNPDTRTLFLRLGGIFSFTPLDVAVRAILDFAIPHEIYITVFLFAVCLLGCAAGAVYRRRHPDPYRPKIVG